MNKVSLDTLVVCDIFISNSSGTKRFSIKGQTLSLSIYEGIFQPLAKCEIVVQDALALAHDMPFIGEEILEVELRSGNTEDSIKYTFHLHGMDNGWMDSNAKQQVYMLRGTSVEYVSDSMVSIQRSYFDTYSNMVKDITSKFLRSKKKVMAIDSKGAHRLSIPNINPLEAIDMIRQRAVSNLNPHSPFLFFETSSGFYFTDIVSCFSAAKKVPIDKITRVYKHTTTDDVNQLSGNAWNSIIAMDVISKHDTTNKTHMGAFYNKMQKFNLLTKDFSVVETKLSDMKNKFEFVTEGQFNSDEFINKMSKQGQLNYFSIVDGTLPESHLDYVGQKRSYSVLFFQNIVEAEFHADTTLEAGKVLYLKLNKTTGLTGSEEDSEDEQQSGYYMISKLAYHIMLTNEPTMRVSCELVKGANKSIREGL